MSPRILGVSILGLALVACNGGGSGPGGSGSGGGTPVSLDPGGNAPPIDHPPLPADKRPVDSSLPQRLSVEQLRGTYPVVLGNDVNGVGITWMIGTNAALDTMSSTLGEADYATTTADDLTPSPLYAKFMNDAARDVCQRVLDADAAREEMSDRVLLHEVDPSDVGTPSTTAIDANIRYLKLRFQGIKVAASDDTMVLPVRKAFLAGVAASTSHTPATQAESGWRVVCVALLTAPEFHIY
jgi:hypothetical protein